MSNNLTVGQALKQWLVSHSFGRKPRTQEFNNEIADVIREKWPDLDQLAGNVTIDDVLSFAQSVTHYCPSRWNAIVSAIRSITPAGKQLKRRALRMRQFSPPSQMEFTKLLAECDAAPRSHAGLVVRFLCLTGLRIAEARGLRWQNVSSDRIEVPASISKSGKTRSVPLLPGLNDILARLRAVDSVPFVLPRQSARKAITSACKRAGLPRMSFHCFRHYFATRCIESGVDVPTVARWMGHQDGGALLSRTYFHLLDSHSRAMAAKVSIAA